MTPAATFAIDRASAGELAGHLARCDARFRPPLHSRVDIGDYARKLAAQAVRFEAWSDELLVGLVAAYLNDATRRCAYVTSVSVLESWSGRGIATSLLTCCLRQARLLGFTHVLLEVADDNAAAIRLYVRSGFVRHAANGSLLTMRQDLAAPPAGGAP